MSYCECIKNFFERLRAFSEKRPIEMTTAVILLLHPLDRPSACGPVILVTIMDNEPVVTLLSEETWDKNASRPGFAPSSMTPPSHRSSTYSSPSSPPPSYLPHDMGGREGIWVVMCPGSSLAPSSATRRLFTFRGDRAGTLHYLPDLIIQQ